MDVEAYRTFNQTLKWNYISDYKLSNIIFFNRFILAIYQLLQYLKRWYIGYKKKTTIMHLNLFCFKIESAVLQKFISNLKEIAFLLNCVLN